MARYILIDAHTGYIWGDSADINGRIVTGTPVEVAHALDASNGEHGRAYSEQSHNPGTGSGYYIVYRADVRGSERVGNIHDGQDRELIEAVERDCELECYVTWTRHQD